MKAVNKLGGMHKATAGSIMEEMAGAGAEPLPSTTQLKNHLNHERMKAKLKGRRDEE